MKHGHSSNNRNREDHDALGFGLDFYSWLLLFIKGAIFGSAACGYLIICFFCDRCSFPSLLDYFIFSLAGTLVYLYAYYTFHRPSDDQVVSWYIRHESFVFQRDFTPDRNTIRIAWMSFSTEHPFRPQLLRLWPVPA